MRRPSTRMSSVAGSAFVPISVTAWPLTVTRPSAMSFSAARRDARPACEMIFWRRMFTLLSSPFSVRVQVRFRVHVPGSCSGFVFGVRCSIIDVMKRVVLLVMMMAACSKPPAAVSVKLQVPLAQLPRVDAQAILAHTKVLSSDEYEGRGPGTKGEELTVNYLVDQFKKIGVKPGNTDGTYVQKVPLVGITPAPAPLVFEKGSQRRTLKWKDDVVAWTKHVAESASINKSEL